MIPTTHFRERWTERIGDKENYDDIFNGSVLILEEKDEKNKSVKFYLYDNIIFVVKQEAYITVYKAEYGFGSEIDMIVFEKLREEVFRLKEDIEQSNTKALTLFAGIESETSEIDASIKVLKHRIELLEARKASMITEKEELNRGREYLESQYEKTAKKLVYSINYNLDMLAEKKNGKKAS